VQNARDAMDFGKKPQVHYFGSGKIRLVKMRTFRIDIESERLTKVDWKKSRGGNS